MSHNHNDIRCARCLAAKSAAQMGWVTSPVKAEGATLIKVEGATLVCRLCVTPEEWVADEMPAAAPARTFGFLGFYTKPRVVLYRPPGEPLRVEGEPVSGTLLKGREQDI